MRGARGVLFALPLAVALWLAGSAPAAAQLQSCSLGTPGWGQPRQDLALQVVRLVNEHRTAMGLTPLAVSPALTRSALWKSSHMARFDYFTHDDPAPPVARGLQQRMRDCGHPSGGGGNIFLNPLTPRQAVEGWLASPGHRTNIELARYRATGVGVVVAADGRILWTQNFSRDATGTPPACAPLALADDRARAEAGGRVTIDVLANDPSLGQREVLRVVAVSEPSAGEVTIGPDGVTLRYRADAGARGADVFSYTAADLLGQTSRALVRVEVSPRRRGGGASAIRLSAGQLLINQRISQAAVRRANGIAAWLDAGVVGADVNGGTIGAADLAPGTLTAPCPPGTLFAAASPRPVKVAPSARGGPASLRLTATQLRINQRISSAAIRRLNALERRLDAGLTGGDIREGSLTQAALGVRVVQAPAAPRAAPTRTRVAPPSAGPARFEVSAAQLLINQRIAQAAVRRANALKARLRAGLGGGDFRDGTIGAPALHLSLRG